MRASGRGEKMGRDPPGRWGGRRRDAPAGNPPPLGKPSGGPPARRRKNYGWPKGALIIILYLCTIAVPASNLFLNEWFGAQRKSIGGLRWFGRDKGGDPVSTQ